VAVYLLTTHPNLRQRVLEWVSGRSPPAPQGAMLPEGDRPRACGESLAGVTSASCGDGICTPAATRGFAIRAHGGPRRRALGASLPPPQQPGKRHSCAPPPLQFPHRVHDETLWTRPSQEDAIAKTVSERQKWKTDVILKAKAKASEHRD